MNLARVIIAGLALLALPGCIAPTPLPPTQYQASNPAAPRQLTRICDRYTHVVQMLRAAPDETWHSGWVGNAVLKLAGSPHRGLCWEWQEAVFAGTIATIRSQGWQACGINLYLDRSGEHHAVVVWDPFALRCVNPLDAPPPRQAWVLDPWFTGAPDVYSIDEWIDAIGHAGGRAAIEPLPGPVTLPTKIDLSEPAASSLVQTR